MRRLPVAKCACPKVCGPAHALTSAPNAGAARTGAAPWFSTSGGTPPSPTLSSPASMPAGARARQQRASVQPLKPTLAQRGAGERACSRWASARLGPLPSTMAQGVQVPAQTPTPQASTTKDGAQMTAGPRWQVLIALRRMMLALTRTLMADSELRAALVSRWQPPPRKVTTDDLLLRRRPRPHGEPCSTRAARGGALGLRARSCPAMSTA
mmetsp:Transcript_6711/g.19632  ORF Transcript_6711/g.19632 Transcript_6711/m.19632 type:complete len:211 (+) Transcript_6711:986-1618(+)